MKKIYFLKSCSTCQRILNALELDETFIHQDIKESTLSPSDLDHLKGLAGSYEALFSRRAKLYKEMGLRHESLEEKDYRHYLLYHYTFLKRPVIVDGNTIFIGNSPKVVTKAQLFFKP
jgi:arsenate reductase